VILELSILALCLVGFCWCCCVSECTATVACTGCSGTSSTLDSAEGYSIVLAGLTDDGCTDCDEFNATFLMDSTAFVNDGDCFWLSAFALWPIASSCGSRWDAYLVIDYDVPTDKSRVIFELHRFSIFSPGTYYLKYLLTADGRNGFDCLTFDSLDVPLSSANHGYCAGGETSTCKITCRDE
jgi:hypothetical protein